MTDQYWMVLGDGDPTRRHQTYAAARQEAARLAMLHRGKLFTVLRSVATVISADVQWDFHDRGDETDRPPS